MPKPLDPLVKKHYPELAELVQEQRDAIRRLETTMHELDLLFGHFTEDKEGVINMFKHLNNKQLVDAINYRYAHGLNDDDYIAELRNRRKKQNKKIAEVDGELFVMVDDES